MTFLITTVHSNLMTLVQSFNILSFYLRRRRKMIDETLISNENNEISHTRDIESNVLSYYPRCTLWRLSTRCLPRVLHFEGLRKRHCILDHLGQLST